MIRRVVLAAVAAVGFGLTAIGIGIDHGWISRTQGVARVLTTLNTFLQGPQGTNTSGTIGYKGLVLTHKFSELE